MGGEPLEFKGIRNYSGIKDVVGTAPSKQVVCFTISGLVVAIVPQGSVS
jgi:hypothetical protein